MSSLPQNIVIVLYSVVLVREVAEWGVNHL
jgi:hypothetical protein